MFLTPRFKTALFTIARRWKQSKCPSMDDWINKSEVHIYIYYVFYIYMYIHTYIDV